MSLINSLIAKKNKLENLYCKALVENKEDELLFYSSQLHYLDRQFFNLGYEINPLILSSDFSKHSREKLPLTSSPSEKLEKSKILSFPKIQIMALGGVKNVNF